MTTFVLVHGACLGGWCWNKVATLLAAGGHRVVAPDLTGLGERAHLLRPDTDLDTHVGDIAQQLRDVVLVGHSYGGMVVSGVAERMADPISSIVLLDAFLPADGQSAIDLLPPAIKAAILKRAAKGATATPPAATANVNDADRAWVDAHCTPHPIKSFLQPVRLTGARERIGRRTYIRASGFPDAALDAALTTARDSGWHTASIAAGHLVMIDAPAELAGFLIQV